MILLIQNETLIERKGVSNLNSIMILLIQVIGGRMLTCIELFKFHYDSINSKTKAWLKQQLKEFKFHYDSINSYIRIMKKGL